MPRRSYAERNAAGAGPSSPDGSKSKKRAKSHTVLLSRDEMNYHQRMKEQKGLEQSRSTVQVRDLPVSVTNKELRELFAQHGPVAKVRLLKSRDDKTRMAIVEFKNDDDCRNAKGSLDGAEVGGEKVKVWFAMERAPKPKTETKEEKEARIASEEAEAKAKKEEADRQEAERKHREEEVRKKAVDAADTSGGEEGGGMVDDANDRIVLLPVEPAKGPIQQTAGKIAGGLIGGLQLGGAMLWKGLEWTVKAPYYLVDQLLTWGQRFAEKKSWFLKPFMPKNSESAFTKARNLNRETTEKAKRTKIK